MLFKKPKLSFKEEIGNYETDWYSENGQYHIAKTSSKRFYAYFKPYNWSNFGQSCQLTSSGASKGYKTFTQSQVVCEKHFEKYGDKPSQWDRV